MQRSALCRSQRELSNAYLLAKFCFDTAEKTSPVKFAGGGGLAARQRGLEGEVAGPRLGSGRQGSDLLQISK